MSGTVTPIQRRCAGCGQVLPREASGRQTCSDRCRQRLARERRKKRQTVAEAIREDVAREPGKMAAATQAKLAAAGRLDTPDGQLAMKLAERLDSPLSAHESATGLLSLQTALSRSVDRALQGADERRDPDAVTGLRAAMAAIVMSSVGAGTPEVAAEFERMLQSGN